MNILCLDLEYNNNQDEGNTPTSKVTDIIQIGAVVLDTDSGTVVDTFQKCVKLTTPLDNGELRLSKFIIQLTGITDEQIESQGVTILEAYEELVEFCKKHNVMRIPATWGVADIPDLREQVESYIVNNTKVVEGVGQEIDGFDRHVFQTIKFITNYTPKWSGWYFSKYDHTGVFDVKKMYQLYRIANNEKMSGGLRKAMNVLGCTLPPNMSYHNAMADAYGTALVLNKLKILLKV